MLAECVGQEPPLFPAEPKGTEEACFAAADGVARVEQVVLDLGLRNDSFLEVRQFHFAGWLVAQGMSRFTSLMLSPPGVCRNMVGERGTALVTAATTTSAMSSQSTSTGRSLEALKGAVPER